MKGDFSRWLNKEKSNYVGVLHQQGRVLLDSDWNDEVLFKTSWQDQSGLDIVGHDVAAVPAHLYDHFKITDLPDITNDQVELKITPGKLWVDGIPIYLHDENHVNYVVRIYRSSLIFFGSVKIC